MKTKRLKWMRGIISLLVCLAMIMPAGTAMKAQAAERPTSGTCGKNVTWSLDTGTGVLTISGSGPMNFYVNNDSPIYGDTRVKKVKIEQGVTMIGSWAFYECTSLTSVEIPDSVIQTGSCAFRDCTSLASIEIPNSVRSIGSSTFQGCTSLTSIEIPNSVTSIGFSTFQGCTSLKRIEIPNSVTSVSAMLFDGCTSLTSIEIPNSLTRIEDAAFDGCTSLASIEIPNSVTFINRYAFRECTNLTSIVIPYGVTSIEAETFLGCTALKKIVIPDTVTTIGNYAFRNCSSLETVVVHGDSKTLADFTVKGDNDAFSNATIVNEPHSEESEVTKMPTKDTPGTRTYTCKICGHKRTEDIPAGQIEDIPSGQTEVSPFDDSFSPAMIEEAVVYPNTTEDPSTLNCKFYHQNGKSYWYENGIRQGTYDDPKGVIGDGTVRGREVCDMETAAWYWCDSVYNGAKAVNKEVWMPYIYQNEKSWSEDEIKQNATASKDEHADMSAQLEKDIKAHTGKWVRYNANGKMFKGWYKVTASEAQHYPDQVGNIYYYDPKTGLMAKGDLTIDGVSYHFDETSGVLQK